MITSLNRRPACPLGLAAHPEQDERCVRRAFEHGINYFFFYGPGNKAFVQGLSTLVNKRREETIIATGSGSRTPNGLLSARRRLLTALGTELIDVFFAEYINPEDDPSAIFAGGGVLDELQNWKSKEWIRFVGATAHDRGLASRLAADARVDVLMHRFNMAHRKAVNEVFPTAVRSHTPVVAFTATRWGSLLEPVGNWTDETPRAADCYRYCLSYPAVHLVLTAPQTLRELDENVEVLKLPPMNARERKNWERFGDLVYGHGKGDYETQWP